MAEDGVDDAVVVRSLRISVDLDEKVAETARKVGLRKADVQRLALERGLDLLLEQLGKREVA